MHCEIIEPGTPAWRTVLDKVPHDFYHRPEYVRLSAEEIPGAAPRAILAADDDGVFFLPFILREIDAVSHDGPLWDAVTPYGYSPPLLKVRSGSGVDRFTERAVAALTTHLAEHRIISLFVRLHPLLTIPLEPLRAAGTLVQHGETVYIDLRKSEQEFHAGLSTQARRNLRRAEKEGLEIEIDTDWTELEQFEEVYCQTMRRVNAVQEYFFTHDYFLAMQRQMSDCMHLFLVRSQGNVIAACLFSELHGIVQYHLSGRRDGFEKSAAFVHLLVFARQWFQARGNHSLHLGGGVGNRADSVFNFKAGFSDDRALFHTWRLITDPAAYGKLVQAWEQQTGLPAQGHQAYFPAYRAPFPTADLEANAVSQESAVS